MSTTYLIYTEIKLKDEWICICPYIKRENGQEILTTTYESGSRTYFGSTYDKLYELNIGINFPDGLSPTLKKKFYDDVFERAKENQDPYSSYKPEDTIQYYEHSIVCVPLHTMRDALPSGTSLRHQYHGIFHKDDIYRYESGETEYIEPVNHNKYVKLDEKEKEAYMYYEYDDPMDWPYHFKEIIRAVRYDLARYIDATASWGSEPQVRIIAFAL